MRTVAAAENGHPFGIHERKCTCLVDRDQGIVSLERIEGVAWVQAEIDRVNGPALGEEIREGWVGGAAENMAGAHRFGSQFLNSRRVRFSADGPGRGPAAVQDNHDREGAFPSGSRT